MTEPARRAVLMIHPRFAGGSFWNYESTCRLVGARYPAPPLGLITVAAMLPEHWDVSLIDRNVSETPADAIAKADLVMIGGMLPQQLDMLELIRLCREAGVPVAVGGPDPTSSPHHYRDADFRILGEVETVIHDFVAAFEAGARSGDFEAEKFKADVETTPLPRFDLLDFSAYVQVNVQFSRGCPFLCEFCDIIELYGRKPRTKTATQMLAELDRLYELGWRGHVDFVDDNLIGNKKAVKAFLPKLIAWQKKHGYPFEFSTEASLNLADDPEFLGLMRDANFFAVFVGIESPDPDVLTTMQKKQNTRRDIAASIDAIHKAGIFVVGGFIIGFDDEKPGAADEMVKLIEEAAIPVAMAGLLYALPNTQLTRRLEREGRLHPYHDFVEADITGDQCTCGLNFDTLRPREDILADYRSVVARVYDPAAFFGRIDRLIDRIDPSGVNGSLHWAMLRHDIRKLGLLFWNVTLKRPDLRWWLWRGLARLLLKKPRAIKALLLNAALYAHLGPFSQEVLREMDAQIAKARADAPEPLLAAS